MKLITLFKKVYIKIYFLFLTYQEMKSKKYVYKPCKYCNKKYLFDNTNIEAPSNEIIYICNKCWIKQDELAESYVEEFKILNNSTDEHSN